VRALLGLACNKLLDIGNALGQDLLQDFGVLELFGDLGDDAVCELFLLALLDLALIADPRVKYVLCLSGEEGLLLELKGLGFEVCGFLKVFKR